MIISERRAAALACGALLLGTGQGAAAADYFERVATFPVYLNLPADVDPASETVAEIVAATPDGMTLIYTDSPGERVGLVDLTDPAAPGPIGTVALDGEPTSVTAVANTVLVAVNTSPSYAEPDGRLAVGRSRHPDRHLVRARRPARFGRRQPRRRVPRGRDRERARRGASTTARSRNCRPARSRSSTLDATGMPTNCAAPRIVDLTGLAAVAPEDPEPEYVSINAANVASSRCRRTTTSRWSTSRAARSPPTSPPARSTSTRSTPRRTASSPATAA